MNDFIKKLKILPDFVSGKGTETTEVGSAEKRLGLKFSDEYKQYLLTVGVASADGHEFTGITPIERINVVNVTEYERKNNPTVPGNLYVIEQANIDGIVIWQSETGEIYQTMPNTNPVRLCNSLSEYIDLLQ